MPSTYTLNNGIELIATGEQSGTWGDTTNTNLQLLDTALDGQITFTLTTAGSSGSPTALPIADGVSANSEGRNRLVIVNDGGDLGATAYVQLTPNDAEKIIYIRNDLSGSRSLILFQGTYSASRDYEVPAGTTAVVYFTGGGSGAAVAANVFNNAYFDSLRLGSVSVTAILDEDNMASDSATALATQQSIKAYVDTQVGANNELSEVLANGNTTGGTDILITSGDSIAAPDASGTDQAGTDVIVSGGAGTGTGAGGEVLFKVAPAGSTGSSVNALATGMKLDSTKALYVDTINELTASAGVTIDSVLLKDTRVAAAGIDASDGTTAINIADTTGAVDIDTSLNVDGETYTDGLVSQIATAAGRSTLATFQNTASLAAGNQATIELKNGGQIGFITAESTQGNSGVDLLFSSHDSTSTETDKMRITEGGDIIFYDSTGSNSFVYDESAGITINDQQAARDFTVKSDNNAAMLYVDGTNDYVAVGSTSITPPSDYHFFSYGATTGARSAFVHGAGDGGVVISGSAGGSNASLILGNNWGTNGSTFSEEWRMVLEGAYDDLTFKYGGSTTAFTMSAAGAAKFYEGLVVNNNNSTGSDFQVKSVNHDDAIFVDASADTVGFFTTDNAPADSASAEGTAVVGNGQLQVSKNGATPLKVNRIGTDGDLVRFHKAGSSNLVGAIGTISNDIYVGTGTTTIRFTGNDIRPTNDTGANNDDAIDLGDSASRFKDVYLSNAVVQDGVKATTTATTQVAIETFAHASHDGAKVVITAATSADTYVTELLIATNGTTAVATEYGQIGTGSALATYDVDISGADVRILATPASTTSTTFRVAMTLT